MKNNILLKLNNVSVHYGGVKALSGVSVEVDEGEVVALLGPNGAGKSTVLKAVFGLVALDSGSVEYNGVEIKLKPYELVELGLSFVPQGKRVFKDLSVLENIQIGGHMIKSREVLKERVEEVLEVFPKLRDKLKEKSGNLSGGEQQMVALARGLVSNPKILLLDEPSLGLAPKIVKEVFEKIKEINMSRKMAVVVVEHNLKSVLAVADRAYVLDKGKVYKSDKGEAFLNSDILEKVFMGNV